MRRCAALLVALLAGACAREPDPGRPLRLGYFPNVTHGQATFASWKIRHWQANVSNPRMRPKSSRIHVH